MSRDYISIPKCCMAGVNPITAGKFTAGAETGHTKKSSSGKTQTWGPGLFDDTNEG